MAMKYQELVDYLKDCGVCQICQLRYLKARGTEYHDCKEYFEKLHVKYEDNEFTEVGEEHLNKRRRLNVCPTCLDLFSTDFQQQLVDHILASNISKYNCDGIVIAISLPMLLLVRQLSMWYALLRKFEQNISSDRAPDVPLKEAIKLLLNPVICKQLQKNYDVNGLMININLHHQQEQEEITHLAKLHEVAFNAKGGQKKREPISRSLLEKKYTPQRVDIKLFEEHFAIPPSIPNNPLTLESLTLTGPTMYVAGRYRKISRELSHTPWVLKGERVMKDSIEEIIIRNVAQHFCDNPNKVVFMSSGREDVDVRCLGAGRPFVLEIPNAFCLSLPPVRARAMEQNIDTSLKVSVRNLQVVIKEDLVHIKSGEEEKRKCYRALCQLQIPATVEMLEKLNLPKGFEIQQKTPIRVLHRRPLHTRPRTIYSLKASVSPQNKFALTLDIITQAGTYIKELVHGEFGRTTPSITSIIGQHIDIIALDVLGIDLDWPPTTTADQSMQAEGHSPSP